MTNPSHLVTQGLRRAFRGLRTGDQATLLLGAALAAFGLLRRSREPRRELLRRETLKSGESLVIREHGGDDEPLHISPG